MKQPGRRGRPPRKTNMTAKEEIAIVNNHYDVTNLDVKQPLHITHRDLIIPTANTAILTRLPQVNYIEIDPTEEIDVEEPDSEEDDIFKLQQEEQEKELLQMTTNSKTVDYKRPENHFIHYIEPTETELYNIVEYDMDDQDKYWLQMYNKERRKEFLGDISPFLFEFIIDKLEKEWFNLIKDIQQPIKEQPKEEDSACAVCDDTEVENSNAIVFCDGCNIAVHQDCYGIPYIPEGQWLCRKCQSGKNDVKCLFCPNEGGAFKPTTTNEWAHLLCAIWIPEVNVASTVRMEPIDAIENIPKSRWKLTCYLCKQKTGACIQCDNKHCFSAFHVTCAKQAKLCMKMNYANQQQEASVSETVILKAYCHKHTPKEYTAIPHHHQQRIENNKITKHHPQQQQHHYNTGAPIIPDVILSRIDNLPCVKNSGIRKRPQLVTTIAHYWSLKRESRRGAPLLKRLQLEPWGVASSSPDIDENQVIKQTVTKQLRADLDKLRILSEQVKKREQKKLERTRRQKEYIEMILFPIEYLIRPLLSQLMETDKKKYFLNHVTKQEAPDYDDIIQHRMCFSEIHHKMITHQYANTAQFKADVSLIWGNAMMYNNNDTSYYKMAIKLQTQSKKLFDIMERKKSGMEMVNGIWSIDIDPTIFDYQLVEEPEEKPIKQPPKKAKASTSKTFTPKASTTKKSKALTVSEEQDIRSLNIQKESALKQSSIISYITTKTTPKEDTPPETYSSTETVKPSTETKIEEPSTKPVVPAVSEVFREPTLWQEKESSSDATVSDEEVTPMEVDSTTAVVERPTTPIEIGESSKSTTPMEFEPSKEPTPPHTEPPRKKKARLQVPARTTRSKGIEATVEEIRKRRKISHEAKALFDSYNGLSNVEKKPVEVYKEDKKMPARLGWVYIADDSTDDEEHKDERSSIEELKKAKYAKRKRNMCPIPNFQRGQIVWARVTGYPSHPAKFNNLPDEQIDPKILAGRRYTGDILVEFLCVPENHKWGWVERGCICEVGDLETDKARLSESLKKRPNRATLIKEAQEGYRAAGKILGRNPEPLLDEVFQSFNASQRKRNTKNK